MAGQRIPFKVPKDIKSVKRINSGFYGRHQAGKILTAYVPRDRSLEQLLVSVSELWPSSCGPAVLFDHRTPYSDAVFFRYGCFDLEQAVSSTDGQFHSVLNAPNGTYQIIDVRNAPAILPPWMKSQCYRLECAAEVIARSLSFADIGVLPLLTLSSESNSLVVLCVDRTAALRVCKIAHKGVDESENGVDAASRLANEFGVLQALGAQCFIKPEPLDLRERRFFSCLQMNLVEGLALNNLAYELRLDALLALVAALETLHQRGYVHGDVKPSNVLVDQTVVRLIDFGTATHIGCASDRSFQTRNYSRSQSGEGTRQPADDYYAVWMMIVSYVLHMDVSRLPPGPRRLAALTARVTRSEVQALLKAGIEGRASSPTALRNVIDSLANRRAMAGLESRKQEPPSFAWILRACNHAVHLTRSYVSMDSRGAYWRNNHLQAEYAHESINVGTAGVILGLLGLKCFAGESIDDDIVRSSAWRLSRHCRTSAAGLFTGRSGVALALNVVARHYNDASLLESSYRHWIHSAALSREFDLFHGDAGVLLTGALLARCPSEDGVDEIASRLIDRLMRSCRRATEGYEWTMARPLDGSRRGCTGVAHGSAGIALALAVAGERWNRPEATALARECFVDLLALAKDGALKRRFVSNRASHLP